MLIKLFSYWFEYLRRVWLLLYLQKYFKLFLCITEMTTWTFLRLFDCKFFINIYIIYVWLLCIHFLHVILGRKIYSQTLVPSFDIYHRSVWVKNSIFLQLLIYCSFEYERLLIGVLLPCYCEVVEWQVILVYIFLAFHFFARLYFG